MVSLDRHYFSYKMEMEFFSEVEFFSLFTTAQSSANYIKHSGRCKDENLRNITNTTEDDCRTRCDADANCKAFEFVPPGAPSPYDALSQCMLKHTIPHFCQCTKWVNCSVKIGMYPYSRGASKGCNVQTF